MPTEYTPTTEEIAAAYCDWDRRTFDRWLAQVKAEAIAAERERVAGILDAIQNSLDSNGSYCECAGYQCIEWLEDQLDLIRAAP